MGVHGLWDLLAPVGRRVSVETLAGKRLAIDASIWMVQFMKAMRDEKGEMVRNAHLLGFFRRICKLLFLRTKPVFVFDGATPALKRRTVIARRRQKENAQAKIRKTAEKLFLNQMKAMRLNNLAENLKGQKDMSKLKGKEIMVENSVTLREKDAALGVKNQEIVDEMLAASILAEECGELDRAVSPPAAPVSNASASVSTSTSKSASAAAITLEDEDGDDDEEMMMPITDGNVDPAVLAALPPSMQLDLLVQMRERLMAENRQKYQKVKKAPQKFSELQIEAYLKTVAFRREIDVVQKAAAGKEVGGVQTSRIASEANREFIFSSSFSGDKQALASSGAENYSEKQQGLEKRASSSDIGDVIAASASKSNAEAEPLAGEVETYLDEKGRKRIHRTRAMGIRMTRDLQRNIDLMKESEHDRTTANNNTNVRTELDSAVGPSESSDCEVQFVDAIEKVNCNHKIPQKSLLEMEACKDAPKTASSINISFCDDGKHMSVDDDDEFFSRLVAGSPVSLCSDDNSASDVEWEDGTNVELSNHLVVGNKVETDVAWKEGSNICDGKLEAMKNLADNRKENEFESDWKKDGTNNFRKVQEISVDVSKAVSKGSAEEEAALQDAIRRSLEDITAEKTSINSFDLGKSNSGSNVFLSGSSSPQLTSTIGDFFLGNVPRQPFAIGNDQSSILAVKDAYAPSPSDRLLEAVDVTTTNLTSARSNENKLCFQHSETYTESVEIRNLSNDGSSEPTVTTFGNLSSSLQAPFDEDLTNEDTTTNLSDMSVGHGGPSMTVETSHDDIHRQIPEEDFSFVSVLERDQDFKFTAPDDVDMNGDLLSASLEDELLELGKEFKDLENEQRKLERNADSVNSEMFVECQELLQMFGLPYIIAPMEAEAQCAFLETANLVDGVVTDDSDVFLFGAQSVFKNIFDDRKYVETYFLKDIESELGLNTEKLIRMALLLGSDYTEGVSGIGIVNAIEVVNAFPEDNGLLKFREWVESPDPSILGKVGRQPGLSAKKNGSKGTLEADCNSSGENEDDEDTDSRKRKELFMNKHRNVSKNWHIPDSFPSDAVISAYKSPQVDKSAEPFAWGKPDIFSLRRLCSEKFSWVNQKADELLLPVLKEYNKHETQLRLEAFYSFNEKFANIRSKRIRQAVKGITGKRALANTDDSEELLKQVKKRGRNASDKGSSKKEDGPRKRISVTKRPKSKKIGVEEGESMQMTDEAEETRVDSTGLSKARGRSGKAVRQGRRKDSSDSELDESSTYNLIGSSDAHDHVLQPEKTALPLNVRRSKRARKTTCYVEKEEESDDLTMSPAMTSERCSNDDTGQQILLECQDALKTDSIDASRPQGVTSDDYFPGNGFCGDYLVEGGGFCADEDDVGLTSDQAGSIHCDWPHGASVDDDSEYLQMGGGFCTDDADEGLDIVNCGGAGPSTGTVADISLTPSKAHEAGHIVDEHSREVVPTLTPTVAPAPDGVQVLQNSTSFVSEVNPSEQHESTGIDPFNAGQTQAVGDHSTPGFVNPFGAIPFLKKKKRKP